MEEHLTDKWDGKEQGEGNEAKSVLRPDCFRILSDKNVADAALEPPLDAELLLGMYQGMLLTRLYDEHALKLQRQGKIGFYVPALGQEAVAVGTMAALEQDDWVFPSHREPGVFLARGATTFDMFCNLFGNENDRCKGHSMPVHYSFAALKLFSVSTPVATQMAQAVGASMASKIRSTKEIAVTFCGDGATSSNDFHSALTFAGVYKTPTIFVCVNNQYALSVPVKQQSGANRLVDKSIGYGVEGKAVDGNDVLAIYVAMEEAVARARKGEGPTLIECFTMRMGPHSSWYDFDEFGQDEEDKGFQQWKRRDPLLRFRQYLEQKDLWDDGQEEELRGELEDELMVSAEEAEKVPAPSVESLFEDVHRERTPQLERQRVELMDEIR